MKRTSEVQRLSKADGSSHCGNPLKALMWGVVAVLAVAITSALPPVAMAQEPPPPAFWVSQDFNNIFGSGWPAEVDVMVTADDPETVEAPDIAVTLTTNAEGSFEGYQVFPGLEPGWLITVTDGEVTKRHTVRNILITDVNLATNIMRGTADPFTNVYAGGADGPELLLNLDFLNRGKWTVADSSGEWLVDVSDVYNIGQGSRVGAAPQMDEDGDFTYTQRQVGLPMFSVSLEDGTMFGNAWPAEVDVMVTADDPETVEIPDIAVTLTTNVQGSFWGPGVLPGVQPGWFITMTDGEITKTHTVRDISITYVSPATNIMRGTADPGTRVDYVGSGESEEGISTVADGSGEWFVDLYDEIIGSGVFDITPGSRVVALQIDDSSSPDYQLYGADGDFTHVGWVVPMTLDELLDDMVSDGRLPNEGVASSIMKQAEKAPLRALTNHLKDLVYRGRITQQTMDQILAMGAG